MPALQRSLKASSLTTASPIDTSRRSFRFGVLRRVSFGSGGPLTRNSGHSITRDPARLWYGLSTTAISTITVKGRSKHPLLARNRLHRSAFSCLKLCAHRRTRLRGALYDSEATGIQDRLASEDKPASLMLKLAAGPFQIVSQPPCFAGRHTERILSAASRLKPWVARSPVRMRRMLGQQHSPAAQQLLPSHQKQAYLRASLWPARLVQTAVTP